MFRKVATAADRAAKCCGCALPHDSNNQGCWGATRVGAAPPVVNGRPTALYRFDTGEYMGTFRYEVVHSWPYSTITAGRLVVAPPR